MVYKLIGMAVVKGAKVFLKRRYGPSNNPKPVAIAVGVVGAAVAVAVLTSKKDDVQ